MPIDAKELLRQLDRCHDCGRLPKVSLAAGLWRIYCPDCERHLHRFHKSLDVAVAFWNTNDEWATGLVDDDDKEDELPPNVTDGLTGHRVPRRRGGVIVLDEGEDE